MTQLHLTDRAVLAIAGAQGREFLQGLVTNDVAALTRGAGLYSALLSPQGKILFEFFIAEGDGALLIDCAAATQDALLKKLRLYRLRAKIEIEARDQLGVYVALETAAAARAVSFSDPRGTGLPARSIGAVAEMPAGLPGPEAYHAARLTLGVPEAGDFGFEKIFALDGGLDELHAVSFTKGCYIGQELTARMKHRATARKRPYRVTAKTALPKTGTPIVANGSEVGEIIAACDTQGFALVRLDRLTDAQHYAAENIPVALARPAWLG